ncbi:MAG: protein kinase domain-containing protein [Planctomycetota bacterium]
MLREIHCPHCDGIFGINPIGHDPTKGLVCPFCQLDIDLADDLTGPGVPPAASDAKRSALDLDDSGVAHVTAVLPPPPTPRSRHEAKVRSLQIDLPQADSAAPPTTDASDASDGADGTDGQDGAGSSRGTRRSLVRPATHESTVGPSPGGDSLPAFDETQAVDPAAAPVRAPAPTLPAPPELLEVDGHTIEKELGRGGMGVVYRAFEPRIGRRVALKVLHHGMSAADSMRFLEEVQIAGQLPHPGIVPVYRLGHDAKLNVDYYTMKLVSGISLAQICHGATGKRKHRGAAEADQRLHTVQGAGEETRASIRSDRAPEPETKRLPTDLFHYGKTLKEVLEIFAKVCQAVAFAHDSGVIHRDLKPANVMVGEYGEVLVMDWGLAKVYNAARASARRSERDIQTQPTSVELSTTAVAVNLESGEATGVTTVVDTEAAKASQALAAASPPVSTKIVSTIRSRNSDASLETQVGWIAGTPAYMSPEQARGEVQRLDPRSDIYSLGAILYELLTLHPPVEGKTLGEVLERVKRGRIEPPNRRAPMRHMPPELSAICMKALAADPTKRFQKVGELEKAIGDYLAGHPQWALVVDDLFERDRLGSQWAAVRGGWRIEKGALAPAAGAGSGADMERALIHGTPILGDMAIECEAYVVDDLEPGELSFVLCAPDPRQAAPGDRGDTGYRVQFGAEDNTCSKIQYNGMDILVRRDLRLKPGEKYLLLAERDGRAVRLYVNGKLELEHIDPAPPAGRHAGLYSWGGGARFEWIRIYSRGNALAVSVLAIPDTFFERGLYSEALAQYRHVADSHPNREVGWLARYKAGLCLVRMRKFGESGDEFGRLGGTPLALLGLMGLARRARAAGHLPMALDYANTIKHKYAESVRLPEVDDELLVTAHELEPQSPESAAALYEAALESNIGEPSLQLRICEWMAAFHLRARNWDATCSIWERMLKFTGGPEKVAASLSELLRDRYFLQHGAEQALQEWLESMAAASTDAQRRAWAATILTDFGLETAHFDLAIHYGRTVVADAECPIGLRLWGLYFLCGALRRTGAVDEALAVLEDALKSLAAPETHRGTTFPNLTQAQLTGVDPSAILRAKGLCLRTTGAYEAAVVAFRAAGRAATSDYFRTACGIDAGTCLVQMDRLQDALGAFMSALRTNSGLTIVNMGRLHLANLLLRMGRTDQARQTLFECTQADSRVRGVNLFAPVRSRRIWQNTAAALLSKDGRVVGDDAPLMVELSNAAPREADELAFLVAECHRLTGRRTLARTWYNLCLAHCSGDDWPYRPAQEMLKRF